MTQILDTPTPDPTAPSVADHIASVTAIYEAFGRGDIDGILSRLADDVVFDDDDAIPTSTALARHPLLSPHRGRAGVADFFRTLTDYSFQHFEITDLLAGQDAEGHGTVVARVLVELTAPDGVMLRDDEMHLWRFDDQGRVSVMRHYLDTAKHLAQQRGEPTE